LFFFRCKGTNIFRIEIEKAAKSLLLGIESLLLSVCPGRLTFQSGEELAEGWGIGKMEAVVESMSGASPSALVPTSRASSPPAVTSAAVLSPNGDSDDGRGSIFHMVGIYYPSKRYQTATEKLSSHLHNCLVTSKEALQKSTFSI
jgi:hypothetical protein